MIYEGPCLLCLAVFDSVIDEDAEPYWKPTKTRSALFWVCVKQISETQSNTASTCSRASSQERAFQVCADELSSTL